MKLLLIRFSSLGDVVLTSPLIRALRAAYPDATLHFATRRAFAPLLESNPHLDRVLTLPGGDAASLRRFARELRAERYDCVLDLHGTLRARALRWLVRGPRWSGYSKQTLRRWLLIRFRMGLDRPETTPVVERYFGAARALGVRPDGQPPEVFPTPDDEAAAEAALREHGLLGEPLVAVAPGARHRTKCWPPDRWAELARRLHAKGLRMVLVGGPEDAALGAGIADAAPGAVNLAGEMSVLASAALIARAACVASGDTGVMHLATAVGTPVVALFGPTTRHLGFFPYSPRATILERELPCRPCTTHGGEACPLGHHRCMLEIGVPEVEAAVRDVVGSMITDE